MEADWEAVREELTRYKQQHLLQFLPELSEGQRAELRGDISDLDFERIERYFSEAQKSLSNCEEKKDELLQPLDSSIYGSTARDKADVKRWECAGETINRLPPTQPKMCVYTARY